VPAFPTPICNKADLDNARDEISKKVMADTYRHCHVCLTQEKHQYAESHRLMSFNRIPESANYGDVYTLETQIDTLCNAACSICGPHYSSLWEKQNNPASKIYDYKTEFDTILSLDIFNKLTRVTLLGGEPLVSDNSIRLLNNIPDPGNVIVRVVTNGSVPLTAKIFEILNKFQVHIVASIDGMGEQFEYIRWPLKWSKVSNNLIDYSANGFKMTVNYTVNPMNIINFPQFYNWLQQINPSINIRSNVCHGIWGTDGTPQILRKYVNDSYGVNHQLTKLLNSVPEVPGKFEKLIENMEMLDQKRNLSYKETFTDALKIINNR
jgi:sulfatase maturation enzyme AslB (radical SAM superfamily)